MSISRSDPILSYCLTDPILSDPILSILLTILFRCLDEGEPEKYILYYSIPLNEIQAVDHGGTRVGRKLLLFNPDGTLKENLQDPVGLSYSIGSIGILN
jgi:hypothetical protein